MIVQVIRTPADFEETLAVDVCRVNCWVPLPGDDAPAIGALMDELFGARDELALEAPEGAGADLAAVAAPLDGLQRLGLQLVAILTRGEYVVPRAGPGPRLAIAPIDMADYLVAPDPCYFRAAGAAFSAPIHTLGAPCRAGHGLIVDGSDDDEKTFRVWTTRGEVVRDFECAVPWCPACYRPDLEAEPAG